MKIKNLNLNSLIEYENNPRDNDVALATQLDIILETSFIRDGTVIGFISMEGISIIENASLAGLPIPKVIKNALEIISKKKKDKDE